MDAVRIAKVDRKSAIDSADGVYDIVFGDETSSNFLLVWRRLPPGRGMGQYHYHEKSENILLVLEGVLEAIVGGKRYLVHPNEIIFMPAGVPHGTLNGGKTEVQVVEIYAPSRGEDQRTKDRVDADLPDSIEEGAPVRAWRG